jgi:hypothetical protein
MWPTDPEYGLSPKNTIGIDAYNPPPVSRLLCTGLCHDLFDPLDLSLNDLAIVLGIVVNK